MRNGWPQLFSWNMLATTTSMKERNTVLWKKLFPAITYRNLQVKNVFRKNYSTLDHSLFLWDFTYYFTKIFVYLSVIGAACYISVYKLLGWNPANIYLFKVNNRTLEKGLIFFSCYFAAPRSTLGHSQREFWTILRILNYFDPKVTGNLVTR